MPPQRSRKRRAPAGKSRPWLPVAIIGGAAVLAVVLVVVFSNVGGGSDSGPKATPGPTHAAVQSGAIVGSDTAPVTMVAYYRFNCIHCRDFATEVEPSLEKDYISTGKLRIEFRALTGEGEVLDASAAALCAGEQSRFWEYYDLVFANMDRGFSKGNLKEYASDLGLDTDAFNSCFDAGNHGQDILASSNEALEAGLTGTPTFFVGKTSDMNRLKVPYEGQTRIPGVQPTNPVAPFKTAIDEILATVQ